MGNTEEIKELGCSYCEQSVVQRQKALYQNKENFPQNYQYQLLMQRVIKGEIGLQSFSKEEGGKMLEVVQEEIVHKKESAIKYYGTQNLNYLYENSVLDSQGKPILQGFQFGKDEVHQNEKFQQPQKRRRRATLETIVESLYEDDQIQITIRDRVRTI